MTRASISLLIHSFLTSTGGSCHRDRVSRLNRLEFLCSHRKCWILVRLYIDKQYIVFIVRLSCMNKGYLKQGHIVSQVSRMAPQLLFSINKNVLETSLLLRKSLLVTRAVLQIQHSNLRCKSSNHSLCIYYTV